MPKTPVISVILPVYNAAQYLKYAVDSILDQTYEDFELILINDGSKDASKEIINRYAEQDDRIITVHQKNIGLVATLNKGIGLAKGTYIARMDADDISLPRRLKEQVRLLEENPHAVLAASCFDIINEYNEFLKLGVVPGMGEDVKRSMRLYNPIAHGSVMFRKDAFLKTDGYSDKVGPTEDYNLWIELAELGDFVISDKSLFRWRINPEGITHSNNDVMQEATQRLVKAYRESHPIKPYSVSRMKKLGAEYIKTYGSIGVIMKEIILEDNYNLGIKAFKEGHVATGVRFVASVAFTGRTGMKITFNRTFDYSISKVKKLLKKS